MRLGAQLSFGAASAGSVGILMPRLYNRGKCPGCHCSAPTQSSFLALLGKPTRGLMPLRARPSKTRHQSASETASQIRYAIRLQQQAVSRTRSSRAPALPILIQLRIKEPAFRLLAIPLACVGSYPSSVKMAPAAWRAFTIRGMIGKKASASCGVPLG